MIKTAPFRFRQFVGLSGAIILSACLSAGPPEIVDLTEGFSEKSEFDRLRYFKEINLNTSRNNLHLTGDGVSVAVMGEVIDPEHTDLSGRISAQFETFSRRDNVKKGSQFYPVAYEILGQNEGHGTHIAGTIAANCDGVGIQGVACKANLVAYDIGAGDYAEDFPSDGWADEDDFFGRFIYSFATGINDLTESGRSKITTGSFNIESPIVKTQKNGPLYGLSMSEIMAQIEDELDGPEDLLNSSLITLENSDDYKMLERVTKNLDEDDALFAFAGLFIPMSSEWAYLEEAIHKYQKAGGVYLVTESNNVFEDRSSTLNAFPELSDKIDPDLWLSVVMVEPDGFEDIASEEDLERVLSTGPYRANINSCGREAAKYCIVTPSYEVFSTMTERLAYGYGMNLFKVDDRLYQSLSGHSMGAPMVAGALALMEEYNRREGLNYSMKDIVRILKENANRSYPGYDPVRHGRGMLDIDAAIRAMK